MDTKIGEDIVPELFQASMIFLDIIDPTRKTCPVHFCTRYRQIKAVRTYGRNMKSHVTCVLLVYIVGRAIIFESRVSAPTTKDLDLDMELGKWKVA